MNLKDYYNKNVIPEMKKKFGYSNDLSVPKITKIVVNVGLGKALKDKNFRDIVDENLKKITGQKPIPTRAKHSISGFGIRKGLIIGEKVTLRGKKMYDFLYKIINVALPRVRDFQGLSSKILDKKGNITIGFKDAAPFPEIAQDDSASMHGLEVTIATTVKTDEEALELLKLLKLPFKQNG